MMPRLRRLSRRTSLRLLAVLGLVLSVVFVNPLAASAATSGTMSFSMGTGGLGDHVPINSVTCQLPWVLNAGGMVVGSTSRCDGGPDITPGMCQPYEGACGSYGLVLKDSSGGTCGSTGFEPYDIGGGVTGVKAGLGSGYVAFNRDSCQPVEACLSYYFDPSVGGTTDYVTCVSVDLDLPVDTGTQECDYGAISAMSAEGPTAADYSPPAGWLSEQYSDEVMVTGKTGSDAGKWVMYVVNVGQKGVYGIGPQINLTGYSGVAGTDYGAAAVLAHNATVSAGTTLKMIRGKAISRFDQTGNGAAPPYVAKTRMVGFGVFYAPDGDVAGRMFTSADSSARVGKTNPSWCTWYWGDKIASPNPSYPGIENPIGPVPEPGGTTEPEPEVPVVEPPEVDTPETDLGLWAAILAVLRAIAAVIGSILEAIGGLVKAILDGITDLFVPDEGFLDSKVEELSDSAEGTTLGNYLDALSGLAPSGSSGCQGPAVSIPVMGNSNTSYPLSACSGGLSQLASASRVIVGVSAGLAAGFACVRILGRGFGWDPGLGGQS